MSKVLKDRNMPSFPCHSDMQGGNNSNHPTNEQISKSKAKKLKRKSKSKEKEVLRQQFPSLFSPIQHHEEKKVMSSTVSASISNSSSKSINDENRKPMNCNYASQIQQAKELIKNKQKCIPILVFA